MGKKHVPNHQPASIFNFHVWLREGSMTCHHFFKFSWTSAISCWQSAWASSATLHHPTRRPELLNPEASSRWVSAHVHRKWQSVAGYGGFPWQKNETGPFWLCKLAILLHFWGYQMSPVGISIPQSDLVRSDFAPLIGWGGDVTRPESFCFGVFVRKRHWESNETVFHGLVLSAYAENASPGERIPFGSKIWQWETSRVYLGPFLIRTSSIKWVILVHCHDSFPEGTPIFLDASNPSIHCNPSKWVGTISWVTTSFGQWDDTVVITMVDETYNYSIHGNYKPT